MWQGPLEVPGGDHQSPIDIAVRKTIFDSKLRHLETSYDPQTCQQIWNNGYSFLVEYDDTTDKNSESCVNVERKLIYILERLAKNEPKENCFLHNRLFSELFLV